MVEFVFSFSKPFIHGDLNFKILKVFCIRKSQQRETVNKMAAINIEIPTRLARTLPASREELEEVLELGLKRFKARRNKRLKNITEETFAALPIKDHKLIEQVIEQAKYGE